MASRSIVPELNFDWLAQLPQTIEQGRRQRVLQETLADLPDLNSASSVEQGAQRLFRAGLYDEGLKLYQAANARRAVDQRGAEMGLYLKWLEKGGPSKAPSNIPPDVVPSAASFGAGGEGPPAAPAPAAAPNPLLNAPNPLAKPPGPRSELQPPLGDSPSNDMIAQAQLAMAGGAAPRGPQLAGPPPTREPPPQPPISPLTVQGAQAPGLALQPPGGPEPPPQAPGAPPGVQLRELPPKPGIQDELKRLEQYIAGNVGRFGDPARRVAIDRYKFLLEQSKYSKEDKQYLSDQADRAAEGLPVQSATRWEANKTNRKETYQEAVKASEDYEGRFRKARDMQAIFGNMASLSKNENFISGDLTSGAVKYGASLVNGLYDAATALGIKPSFTKEQIPFMNSSALMEAFGALQKQAILAMMGSFGNNISNKDVETTVQMFPGLGNTSKGIQLLSEIMQKMADKSMEASRVARAYRAKREGEANAPDMHTLVDNYYKEHGGISVMIDDKGNLTDLGRRVQEELSKRPDVITPAREAIQGYFGRQGGAGVPAVAAPGGPAPSPAPVPRRRPLESFQSEGEL